MSTLVAGSWRPKTALREEIDTGTVRFRHFRASQPTAAQVRAVRRAQSFIVLGLLLDAFDLVEEDPSVVEQATQQGDSPSI